MPFGSWMAHRYLNKRGIWTKFAALYLKLFGYQELYGHIRFRALRPFFQRTEHNVDIGAGSGITSIGFCLLTQRPILALAYTEEEEKDCRQYVAAAGLGHLVTCKREDALKLDSIGYEKYDQALLLDVLEHVHGNDLSVLENINNILRMGGYLILSVPTIVYPKYFPQEYDSGAGHLRHYTLEQLEALLKNSGFEIVDWQYYVNPFAARLCSVSYKLLCWHRYLGFAALPFLNLLSLADQGSPLKKVRSPVRSAALALFAVKRRLLTS